MAMIPNRNGCKSLRTFVRPLVGIVVAYALVFQVFAAAAGPRFSGGGANLQSAFELCAHAAQGGPALPGDLPDRPGLQHCVFCFTNVNLALAAPRATSFRAAEPAAAPARWRFDASDLPQLPQYAIARPRGPPFSA